MIENVFHFTLVFVVAATALRCSEVLALRWADIIWEERNIRIVKSWKKTGVDGDTKTKASERNAPMGRVLMHYLLEWRNQTPYGRPSDFVFPFDKGERQSTDLLVGILRRPLAPCGKSSRRNHPRRASLGSAQPPTQPVELVGEQSEGEPEDGAGHLGSLADSDHARPLHTRRPRRNDRGSGKVSRCRGIRIG